MELDTGALDMELTGFDEAELEKLLVDKHPGDDKTHKTKLVTGGESLDVLAPSSEEDEVIKRCDKIIIEFSGGKDSSSAALWAKHFYPQHNLSLMFADLGADYPGFQMFLYRFAEVLGAELVMLRSKESIIDLFIRKGTWPHFGHPYCHNLLHDTLDTYVQAQPADKVIIMRGGRVQEKAAKSKKNVDRFLKIDRLPNYTYFQPLYFADKEIGPEHLTASGLPIWEGYSYGLGRTCCRICPGQRTGTYAAVRCNFPDIWEELLELERRLGQGCWSDPENKGSASFRENADRGEKRFQSGGYKIRQGLL